PPCSLPFCPSTTLFRSSAETAVLCAPWSRRSTVVSADSLALRRCFGAASLFRAGLQRRARGEEQRRAGAGSGARCNSQGRGGARSEEHTSELQSRFDLV